MRVGPLQAIGWSSAMLVLSNCNNTGDLPEGVEIVAGAHAQQMLNQCSRAAPEEGENTWQPTAADVREFEAQLSAELPHQLSKVGWLLASEKEKLDEFPVGFWREYVGIVRQNRRYIYGNFGPVPDAPAPWSASMEGPTDICDGGPVYFGAEYDTGSKTITHWAFNGPLG